MVSIHPHTNAKAAVDYLDDHLESNTADYYSQNGLSDVKLFGKGLDILGLGDCTYSKQLFAALADNIHPLTKKQITPRRRANARSCYDATLSAPKSISVVALIADDPRIVEAHTRAVAQTLLFMESRAMTRVRKNGADTDRATGNIAGISFLHFTSRDGDPQIHSHNCTFNLTHDEEENRFKSLQSSSLYRSSALTTEIYRSFLAKELHQIGYRTHSTAKGFEIEGVPKDVIDIFSKRRISILKTAQEDLVHPNSPKGRNAIARSSRKAKEVIPLEQSRADWIAQLTQEQYASLLALKENAKAPIVEKSVSPEEALDWAKRHLFERKSVITSDELAISSLQFARGQFSYEQVASAIENSTTNGEFIRKGDEFTTQEAVDAEHELIALVNKGGGIFSPLNETFHITGKSSKEQREVIGKTLLSRDRITAIRGPAGSGKTTTLTEVVKGVRQTYGNPVILAPSGSATEVLRNDDFFGASTLQRFLDNKADQLASAGRVVIVDEAGMISVNQMLKFLKLAEKHDFRVILVGDTRQHHSVEWGNALQILENHSNLQTASLTEIHRQKNKDYRSAVSFLKDGLAVQGFDKLDAMGCVYEIEGEERGATLARDFAEAVRRGETALAVSPTWAESSAITADIRSALRGNGVITGNDTEVTVLVPLHKTEAERELSHAIGEGRVLVFQRKNSLFARGEQVVVCGEKEGMLVVRRVNGEKVIFDPKKHATSFQVFETKPLHIASGDKLLLRSNGKSADGRKLINGQIVTIKKIEGDIITLADGRKLPSSYRHFTHGVCISSQASQGKTVQNIYLAMSVQSTYAAGSLEGFYVAASRGRLSCHIYTDAKEELRDAVQNSSARKAAIELLYINSPTKPSYEHKPIRKPTTSLPTHLQLAHPPGRYPLHRNKTARDRDDALVGDSHPHQRNRGTKDVPVSQTTRESDCVGGRAARNPVSGKRIKRYAPELG